MRRLLLLLVLIGSINLAKGQSNHPSINCDSLKKMYRTQIDSLKKDVANTALVEQLEMVLKQMEDLYCNAQKNAGTSMSYSGNNPDTGDEADEAFMNSMLKKGKLINTSFKGTYTISMRVSGAGAENAAFAYYLDPQQQKILLDKSSFSADPSVKNSLMPGADTEGSFDGWLIDAKGQNLVFTTTKEMGKIAMEINPGASKKTQEKQPVVLVKPGAGSKTIAGYECTPYSVTITEGREKMQFTCWISKQDLPFVHPSYTMFSMFSASQFLKNAGGKRGVLAVEGRTTEGAYNFTVTAIERINKQRSFSGYQTIQMPTGLF